MKKLYQNGKNINNILHSIYYNIKNKNAYSSILKLLNAARKINRNINLEDVKNWLNKQETYTTHKISFRKFKRNPIIVSKIDQEWQIDLMDVSKLSKYNNKYNFILVCIDVLSKYLWLEPIKNKNSQSVYKAFKSILLSSNRRPNIIYSDAGSKLI